MPSLMPDYISNNLIDGSSRLIYFTDNSRPRVAVGEKG